MKKYPHKNSNEESWIGLIQGDIYHIIGHAKINNKVFLFLLDIKYRLKISKNKNKTEDNLNIIVVLNKLTIGVWISPYNAE